MTPIDPDRKTSPEQWSPHNNDSGAPYLEHDRGAVLEVHQVPPKQITFDGSPWAVIWVPDVGQESIEIARYPEAIDAMNAALELADRLENGGSIGRVMELAEEVDDEV